MNKTIWKYPLNEPDKPVMMPEGAEILTVQNQHGTPTVWALVDPNAELQERLFEAFGTGHDISEDIGIQRKYINTFQLRGGSLVFHLFERLN